MSEALPAGVIPLPVPSEAAIETQADAAVEIAQIEADTRVAIAEIAADAATDGDDIQWLQSELAVLRAACDANGSRLEALAETIQAMETARETMNAALMSLANDVLTLQQASLTPPAPSAEPVEVMEPVEPAEVTEPAETLESEAKAGGHSESPGARAPAPARRKRVWI